VADAVVGLATRKKVGWFRQGTVQTLVQEPRSVRRAGYQPQLTGANSCRRSRSSAP